MNKPKRNKQGFLAVLYPGKHFVVSTSCSLMLSLLTSGCVLFGTPEVDDTPECTASVEVEADCQMPGQVGNSVDDDCDGVIDEGCSCNFNSTTFGVCSMGVTPQTGGCSPPTEYETIESRCDGKDNDCDGVVDEGCAPSNTPPNSMTNADMGADMGENVEDMPEDNDMGGSNTIANNMTSPSLFTDIVAGGNHTCAIQEGGALWCWGRNHIGQVGVGLTVDRYLEPKQIVGLSALEVELRENFSCAVTAGDMRCWGSNEHGKLGHNSEDENSKSPVVVFRSETEEVDLHAPSLGPEGVCALNFQQAPFCWGLQHPDGQTPFPLAVTPAPDKKLVKVEAGADFTCALDEDQHVWCWGSNTSGGLGRGDGETDSAPQRITMLPDVKDLAVGRYTACAIIADNSVYCWGANEEGLISQSIQFGAPVFTPTLVEHAPRGTAIAMGESSACVIEMNKKVTCWGAFGNGSSQSTTSPSNLTDIERISLGFMHACALDSAGKAYCWGDNTYGQIGDGTEFSSVEVAIEVSLSP